jgi:antibiotic biosynthesis monooxygenase (ABM) superfamily enzyme
MLLRRSLSLGASNGGRGKEEASSVELESEDLKFNGERRSPRNLTVCSIVVKVKLKNPSFYPQYTALLNEMTEFCHSQYKGHLYSGLVEHSKSSGLLTNVHRFDTMENLQNWMSSADRARFRAKFLEMLEYAHADVVEGPTNMFTAPEDDNQKHSKVDGRKPPIWKTALLIFSALYPLKLLTNYFVVPALKDAGWSQVGSAAITFLMVMIPCQWVIYPVVFKIADKWLKAPRPQYPRHSGMFILDSGFSIFKPVNPDLITPLQEVLMNRIAITETLIQNLQQRLRFVEVKEKLTLEEGDSITADMFPELLFQDRSGHVMLEKVREDAMNSDRKMDLPVTIKLAVRVPAVYANIYEQFARDAGRIASEFEGFLGRDVIRPAKFDASGAGVYVAITRFRTHAQLMKWIQSKERKELLLRVYLLIHFLDGEVESENLVDVSGFEQCFPTLETASSSISFDPSNKKKLQGPPAKWKTFLVTYCLLLGTSQFSYHFVSPHFKELPMPLSVFVVLFLAVLVIVYILNPLMNKFLQDWIHGYTMDEIPNGGIGRILHIGLPCFG